MITPSSEPRASAIVVTHNRPQFLSAAIASVLDQTLSPIEVVIVDDGSTDDTPATTARIAERDPRVRVIRQGNLGPAAARNTGLAHTRADWVAFLDDDDLWAPEALEELLEGAPSKCEAVACLALRFCAEDPRVTAADVLAHPDTFAVEPWPPVPPKVEIALRELLQRPLVPIHAALFRRKTLEALGGFESSATEDYDLWLRLTLRGPVPVVPRALALYRWHSGQRSAALELQARDTRQVLERFLSSHPNAIPADDRGLLRRRLAGLAREEAYAALLEGDGRGARRSALRAVSLVPVSFKAWFYLVASQSPALYRSMRKRWRGDEG